MEKTFKLFNVVYIEAEDVQKAWDKMGDFMAESEHEFRMDLLHAEEDPDSLRSEILLLQNELLKLKAEKQEDKKLVFDESKIIDFRNADKIEVGNWCLIGDTIRELQDKIEGREPNIVWVLDYVSAYEFFVHRADNEDIQSEAPFLYALDSEDIKKKGKWYGILK